MTEPSDTDAPMRYDSTKGLALWGVAEETAAAQVVRSRSLFRYYGPDLRHECDRFEGELATRHPGTSATVVTSGTAALACAMVAAGLPDGAEVIVPAVTFVGCANAVLWARGVPVFADIDDTMGLDADAVDAAVTDRTAAIMVVHLNNAAADIEPLRALAERRGLALFEDAAQAAGIEYGGRPVGTFGDAAILSFQLEKNVSCGEGGALLTRHADWHDRATRYQDQGGQFTTGRGEVRGDAAEPFAGVNLRMSEVHAAIGRVQLARLDQVLDALRAAAAAVRERLADLPIDWRRLPDADGAAGDLTLFLPGRLEARNAIAELRRSGIPARAMYGGQAVYANPAIRAGRTAWGTTFSPGARCRSSERLLGRSVTVDLGPAMSEADVEAVADGIRRVVTSSPPAG